MPTEKIYDFDTWKKILRLRIRLIYNHIFF